VIAKGLQPFRRLTGTPITSWLSKSIHQGRSPKVELTGGHLNGDVPQTGYLGVPSKLQSAPEILGVIPEQKNDEI